MFRHPERAQRTLVGVEHSLSPDTREALHSLLAQSPDPDSALRCLDRYLSQVGSLPATSRLHALLAVFAHSHFLSETLFQRPELLEWVFERGVVYRVLSTEELLAQMELFPVEEIDRHAVALELARFKRRNLLRIMLRDVLGLATLAEVTLELSNLADALLKSALDRVYQELIQVHGPPWLASSGGASERRECDFAVLALGKLGGQELNYSSDIDLMYLFSGAGETDGPKKITNKEFFIKLANQHTDLLSSNTTEGFCYRVDLRLRPEGRLGEVAQSWSALRDYYQQRARDWELQMLIKARVAAGSRSLGHKFLQYVEPLIYKTTTDFSAVESVSETRERIHEKLQRRRAPFGLNVKLSRGGIRDIEFLVQCLQRLYGGRDPWVRHGGTLVALHRLRDKGYLSARDYARLNTAYQFLRTVEHRLQLEHDRQIHTLPQDQEALETLALKVGASGQGSVSLLEETERHLREVTAIYNRVIHGHGPASQQGSEAAPLFQLEMESPQEGADLSMQAQLRYLETRAPELAARIAGAPLRRGRRLFEHFLAKVVSMPDLLEEIGAKPELIELAADLFEYSPFFAEWLIRNPEEIHQLLEVAAFAASDQQASLFPLEPATREAGAEPSHPELELLIHARAPVSEKSAWLRRFYRRQMLRIQAESICRRSPIFATLEQTTQLGDWVVQAAYRIALDEIMPSRPSRLMHVVALGRLGMREFDLGSDADLVFVVPDEGKSELPLWTRVAERIIEVLASYTGEGVMFSVDTRLRPLGREGELVQTESAYERYFAEHAQAWEAITYMKSRCLAGDVEKGTAFLHDLQNVDWRRYGQSGTLAGLLAEMRRKLEKEQGEDQPLKAGRGGYYDIDFVLMYLRLKGAGIFYTSLNTPERIDVIERMGWLTREDAEFLRSAAVFYRALDHGLRVSIGRSLGTLPKARSQYEIITELVRRWTPASLHDRPLDELLAETRQQTREMFNRVFEVSAG